MSQEAILKLTTEEFHTNSGVDRHDRAELAERLSSALANTYLLYLKTQNCHWNVVGPLFFSIHKLTEQQYQDMAEAIDSIAERIRILGFIAPGSFLQFSKVAVIKEELGSPKAEAMIAELAEDNEMCSRLLREAVVAAEKVNDVKTADLLTDRIGQHEENTWMLRALCAS
ncbi:Dps family protein [Oceanicoccus sp. KOV_DT_Chl]|uniref:Dps family protein n=1 Tax=Oceanicoccus sp. KOV_DT_Chl TaxID=1904639 RepID=UPI000C7B68FB|nr:Dps family protein [Oceanicoccus sp. KOV_DT_Chl]